MSDLIAIAYDDVATAERVRDELMRLQREQVIVLDDAVVVERKEGGKIKLHQARSTTGAGAASGTLWGGLIGLIFFMPLLGMAVGAASGAALGSTIDVGVDDDFMRDLGQNLRPGAGALFLLVAKSTPDKVIPQVAKYGGQLIKTSLSADAEEHLKEMARAAQPA